MAPTGLLEGYSSEPARGTTVGTVALAGDGDMGGTVEAGVPAGMAEGGTDTGTDLGGVDMDGTETVAGDIRLAADMATTADLSTVPLVAFMEAAWVEVASTAEEDSTGAVVVFTAVGDIAKKSCPC